MTRTLVALALGASLVACATPRYTQVDSDDTKEFGVVKLGSAIGYIIDPRTETCVLAYDGLESAWAVPVPCARLKANVPAAARFITWEAAAAP